MRSAYVILPALLAVALGAGCDADDTDTNRDLKIVAADEPGDTLDNVGSALEMSADPNRADEATEAFMAQFQAEGEDARRLAIIWDLLRKQLQYRTLMRRQYGQNAIKGRGAGELEKVLNKNLIAGAKLPKEITGDRVKARIKGRERPLTLVKVDGTWKIVARDLLPPGRPEAAEQYLAVLDAMTEVLDEAIAKIGRDDQNAARIRDAMHEQMALHIVRLAGRE